MRRTMAAAAVMAVAALLTGCGGAADAKGGSGTEGASGAPSAVATPSGKAEGQAEADTGTSYEVTIEVGGTGSTMVMYTLDESKTETVTLPWKKTATITPVGAEKEVGRLVLVTPGTITDGNGMLTAASCTITVDGKKVADNDNGKVAKPCSYKIK
ncbi:hypothetical protein [Streptomyces sp. TRM64462]|uniref:hypothetical protein n=1 Tax=Streptomyces sp. TRM64462 TaxID=2741726 RepID=UPI0015862DDF|nr:hypothetical protein [Streptomyces sp. TRM64462]